MDNKIIYKFSIGINENIMNGVCDNHYRIYPPHEAVVLILLFLFYTFFSSIVLRKYL